MTVAKRIAKMESHLRLVCAYRESLRKRVTTYESVIVGEFTFVDGSTYTIRHYRKV
jgi:hypothetical protein